MPLQIAGSTPGAAPDVSGAVQKLPKKANLHSRHSKSGIRSGSANSDLFAKDRERIAAESDRAGSVLAFTISFSNILL